MKVLSAILASAFAQDPTNVASVVSCDDDGTVSMQLRITNPIDNKVPSGFSETATDSGIWEATVTDVSTLQKDWATAGKLKLIANYGTTGCDEEEVDGVTVCVATGNSFQFTCIYDLDDKTISDDQFTVTGQDVATEAENTGNLGYDLTVSDNTEIGNTVTFTISPKNDGLVAATVKSCSVGSAGQTSVTIIGQDDNKCLEGKVNAAAHSDTPNLSSTGDILGSWTAFKWSTSTESEDAETQTLSCIIALTQAVDDTAPEACPEPQADPQ